MLAKRGEKLLSLLLALSMCVGMAGISVSAAGGEDTEGKTLICTQEEHTHSIEAGCYALTCTLQEAAAHTHTVDCYAGASPICNNTDADHVHALECYMGIAPTCGLTEGEGHTHTEVCYDLTTTICEKVAHVHDDSCYEPIPTPDAAVENVIALITALPAAAEITLDSEAAILAARAAYDTLTAEQQQQVTNLGTLLDAEAAIASLQPTEPTPVAPPQAAEWDLSKSKEATNLNENYESDVTLSLPAGDYKGDLDVVFVLDGSTSTDKADLADAAAALLDSLANYENLNTKASVVIFGGSVPILEQTELLALSEEANLTFLKTMITDSSYDSYPGRSGSNLQAGVDAARTLLNGDAGVSAEDKYMVILTDGGARMWHDGEGNALSQTYLPNNSIFWNSNEDFAHRYPTGNEAPGFSDVWNAGQSGINIGKYGMTQTESQSVANPANDPHVANWDTVKNGEDYYTTLEAATYYAATSIAASQSEMHVLWVDYPYHNNTTIHAQYINSFKSWLADNGYITRFDSSAADPEQVFSAVEDELIQLVAAGSEVVDVIGYGDDYNFDFVNDINKLTLTVDGTELAKASISETSYGFGGSGTNYDFVLTYYADGTTYQSRTYGECFIWEINVSVTKDAPVELTYSVVLTNPKTSAGTYGQYDADGSEGYTSLYTNSSATLYPIDSNGAQGMPENFLKPTVSYTVSGGTVIIPPDTPTPTPEPAPDEDIPDEDIPDEDVPQADVPETEVPTVDEPVEDIPEDDVPMADAPETGDSLILWLSAAALSGMGLIALAVTGHRRMDEEL